MKRYIAAVAFGFFLFFAMFVSRPALSGSWLLVSSAVAAIWGQITGTVSNQLDLQAALDLKANLASPTFTGVASFADGSNTDPSITNTGDTNTGVYFPAADQVGFTAGGTLIGKFQLYDTSYPALLLNPGSVASGISRISFKGTTPGPDEIVYRPDLASGVYLFNSGSGSGTGGIGTGRVNANVGGNGVFTNSGTTSLCAGGGHSSNGNCGVNLDASGNVALSNQTVLSTTWTPAATTDACTAGRFGCDSSYCYYCVASGNVHRMAHAAW